MPVRVLPATNADCPGIVGVVKAVFDEYGFTWEEEGYHADLYDVQSHYAEKGHAFFVAVSESGEVQGTIALRCFDPIPGNPGGVMELNGKRRLSGTDCSLDRLYVLPSARKQGLGSMLASAVIEEAKRRGKRKMEIWSDKRFVDAHRLYGRFGAVSISDRILDDPDQSPEWGLVIEL